MTTTWKHRRPEETKTPSRTDEPLPPRDRAEQRDTAEQLRDDPHPARPDEPTAWERELQERLPPRGEGSQRDEPVEKPTAEPEARTEDTGPVLTGAVQTGGPRGPSSKP